MDTSQPSHPLLASVLAKMARIQTGGDAHRIVELLLLEHLKSGATLFDCGVSDIAVRLGAHRNGVSKALAALEAAGVVTRASSWGGDRRRGTRLAFLTDRAVEPSNPPTILLPAPEPRAQGTEVTKAMDHAIPCINAASNKPRGMADLLGVVGRFTAILQKSGPHRSDIKDALLLARESGVSFVPDPTWGLSEGDVEALCAGIPSGLSTPPIIERPAPLTAIKSAPDPITPQLALALRHAMPKIEKLATKHKTSAHALLRQIAYSISCGQINQGDAAQCITTALNLIARQRWTAPRGMPKDWECDLKGREE